MKILGISLGHDSNFSLVDNGEIISVYEAERYYRQKRYKLQALNPGEEKISGYQIVKYSDLVETLVYLKNQWGSDFDFIAVQNQGREDEFQRLRLILNKIGIKFKNIENFPHHLSHASLAYFTSPFNKSIIFSYDGAGNDGQTLLFKAEGNQINYFKNFDIKFGQAYNNLGYIMGLKPDVAGSTAGKLMGLTSYGEVREDWKEHCRNYISNYKKINSIFKNNKKIDYGKNHKINSIGLNNIREFNSYLYPNFLFSNFFARLGLIKQHLKLNDLKNKDFQDLCKTFQIVWSEEVIKILKTSKSFSENLCIVGGCALNGITNYIIEKEKIFKKVHYVPNPSDCGLSIGSALLANYKYNKIKFAGKKSFFNPYLGDYAYDLKKINILKKNYYSLDLDENILFQKIAKIIFHNSIIGVIRGRYEIGPRALGNRSILSNPLNKNMKQILNDKVKHREWFRPFAPVCAYEDSKKFFTNQNEILYMSVICYTKEEYQAIMPAITHIDGSARLQTVTKETNFFLWKLIKEFKNLSNIPVLLNTSFNPGGEPIVNFCEVGLKMLETTNLDYVLIENTIFTDLKNKDKLNEIIL